MNSTLKPLSLTVAMPMLLGGLYFLNGCHKTEPQLGNENAVVTSAQNNNSNPAQSTVPPSAVKETGEQSKQVASQSPTNARSKPEGPKALQSFGLGDRANDQLLARVRSTTRASRFRSPNLRVARGDETLAAALEDRASTETKLSQVEQNAQRLSGQLDELAAGVNTAKSDARAVQETADSAVAGVNATNERNSALDDYVPQTVLALNFKTGSATLSADAKTKLDELATKALNSKGYVLEVSGFTDTTGSVARNRALSQRRADNVIRYLVENHQIPLQRIVTPYGFGESNPTAENTTSRTGRAENRRVEVKLLVNKALMQGAPFTP